MTTAPNPTAERPDSVKRRICTNCGARLYNAHRAKRHEVKTGHRTTINVRAERAVMKHLARQNPTYLDRLVARDRELSQRSWN